MSVDSTSWKNERFRVPDSIPTMIEREEQQYLHWLTRTQWTGEGNIVEIGPWLGGSTVCLASGLDASERDADGRLHAYDNFVWREFMAERAQLPLTPGASFEPFFLKNLERFAELVVSHRRTLPDEALADDATASLQRASDADAVSPLNELAPGPIEILFIDGAKSWMGMRHLLQIARAQLIPGTSLLVCQDYKYWSTYWVPIIMSRLGDCVVPVHDVRGGTTVAFRLEQPLPEEGVASMETHVGNLDTAATLASIDRAASLLRNCGDREGAAHVALSRVSFLSHQRNGDAAVSAFRRSEREWPALANPTQLSRARAYLRREWSIPLPPSVRRRVLDPAAIVLLKTRGTIARILG